MAKIGPKEIQSRALTAARFGSGDARKERHLLKSSAPRASGVTSVVTGGQILATAKAAQRGGETPTTELKSFDAARAAPRKPKSSQPPSLKASVAVSEAIKQKLGRPRIEDRDKTLKRLRPWVALGMSRSTWYSRQAELRTREKQKL